MIRPVLLQLDHAPIDVRYRSARECDLPAVVECEHARTHRPVRNNLQPRLGSLHGSEIAATLFNRIREFRPIRRVIGHPDLFDRRYVRDPQMEMRRLDRAGVDEILDVFGHSGKQELKPGRRRTRLHRRLFPFCGALVAHVDPELVALQAMQLGRYQLVGVTSHSRITRADAHLIQRLAWRPGPQSRSAIAEIARPGADQPEQCAQ